MKKQHYKNLYNETLLQIIYTLEYPDNMYEKVKEASSIKSGDIPLELCKIWCSLDRYIKNMRYIYA